MKCSRCKAEAQVGLKTCSACTERRKVSSAKYRSANSDTVRACNKNWRDRNNDQCKLQRNSYRRAVRLANPDIVRAKDREREKRTGRSLRQYKKDPDYAWRCRLKRMFGLDKKAAQDLIDLSRVSTCASCGTPAQASALSRGKFGLHIDHEHSTGHLRGLLCSRCNQALGLLDDDKHKIKNLLIYLEK
jgi:hypothetical protein